MFPTAAYVVTAFETALVIAGDKAPQAIVISELNIDQALASNEDNAGTEILITV